VPEPSAEILFRAARGDRVALGRLIEQQQTYIYSIAMSLLRPPPTRPMPLRRPAFG